MLNRCNCCVAALSRVRVARLIQSAWFVRREEARDAETGAVFPLCSLPVQFSVQHMRRIWLTAAVQSIHMLNGIYIWPATAAWDKAVGTVTCQGAKLTWVLRI